MALSKELSIEIRDFLKAKLLKKIEEYSLDNEDSSKPFQYALFTKKGYLVKGFIHGCETALGNWHEGIAKIIGKKNFTTAEKLQGSNKLKGKITREALRKIENILSNLDSVIQEPDNKKETSEIFSLSLSGETEDRIQTVDLYLKSNNGEEVYFEIKGPKPNKNEMRAAKRDLLEIFGIRASEGKKVKIFLGMYYNPYYPEEYKRWTCLKFFDLGKDFLIGKDFWDFIGGEGTYEQLIKIYENVGEEVRPFLDKKLKSFKV